MKKILALSLSAIFALSLPVSAIDVYMETAKGQAFTLPAEIDYNGGKESVTWQSSKFSTATNGIIHVDGTLVSDSGVDVDLYITVSDSATSVTAEKPVIQFEQKTATFTAAVAGTQKYASLLIYKKAEAPVSVSDSFVNGNIILAQNEEISEGSVTFDVNFKDFTGGDYLFYVLSGGVSDSDEFEYINYDEFIVEVKGVTSTDAEKGTKLFNIFKKYSVVVNLKLDAVYSQMSDEEKKIILEKLPALIEASAEETGLVKVLNFTDETIALKMLNEAGDKKTIIDSDVPYAEVLGVDTSQNSYYKKIKDLSAFYGLFSVADLSDVTKVKQAFYNAAATVSVNEADRTNIYDVLKYFDKVSDITVLNITEALEVLEAMESSERESVLSQIALISNFTSPAEIKSQLESLVGLGSTTTTPDSGAVILPGSGLTGTTGTGLGTGGGGGGGTGGGLGGFGGMAAVSDGTTEVDETQYAKAEYDDISEAEWARPYINKLTAKGVIEGYNNKIRPNDPITREEIAKLIVVAAELADEEYKINFTDVLSNEWYAEYINSLYNAGIVKGISEERFGTGQNITREDISVMVYRAMQHKALLDDSVANAELFADDSSISDYAKEAVYKIKELEIVSGVGNNSFMPKGICSRAMAFKIISEAFYN